MAHPKRRQSHSRSRKRRNHKRLKAMPYYIDPVAEEPTLYHRVCLESGYYRGKKVMKGKEDVE